MSCPICNQPDQPTRPGTADSNVNVLAPPYCPACQRNRFGAMMPNTNPNNTDINAADYAQYAVLNDEALAPILRMLQSKLLPHQAYQQFLDEMANQCPTTPAKTSH